MDAQQLAVLLIILLAFIFNAIIPLVSAIVQRRERAPLRRIAAFEALPKMLGESIEASRPLHVSLGSASIGDQSTVLSLAGSEFIYYLTRQVAIGDASPLFTVSEGAALPLAMDTLRRAYTHENRSKQFNAFGARWYPAGKRSLAFAAALMSMQADDKLSGNILFGSYGSELALVLDAAFQKKRYSIASSDLLEGQAIAYALADESLIGDEVFAAAAYLGNERDLHFRVMTLDFLRLVSVIAIIVIAIFSLSRGGN